LEIYKNSSCKYTIVDLQGTFINNCYVLTDIEYTNTIDKLGWDKNELLSEFEKLNNLEISSSNNDDNDSD